MLNSKFLLGLIIGTAAGVVITYLFATEDGQEIIAGVSDLEKDLRKDFEKISSEFKN